MLEVMPQLSPLEVQSSCVQGSLLGLTLTRMEMKNVRLCSES